MNQIKTIQKSLLAILPVVILASTVSAKLFERENTREFIPQPGQQLAIDVGAADVEVRAGNSKRVVVQVLMSVKASSLEKADEIFDAAIIEFSEDPTAIKTTVRTKNSSLFGLFSRKSADIRIIATCPPEYDLSLDSGSGDIFAEGVSGNILIDTGSGDVSGKNLSGTISVDTGSGDIKMMDLNGSFSGDTGSGDIKVIELSGSFIGDTGSGDLQVRGSVSQFTVSTGSGDISVHSSNNDLIASAAASGSGDIELFVPKTANFVFQAKSQAGSISSDFPNAVTTSASKDFLVLTINQGGPVLDISTGSGDLSLQIHE